MIPQMIQGAFNIPVALHDMFNKFLRREDSLYTREEQPFNVEYTYGEYTYRGKIIKLIDQIIVEYESSKPTEVFTAIREGEDGVLLGSKRTIHYETPSELYSSSMIPSPPLAPPSTGTTPAPVTGTGTGTGTGTVPSTGTGTI